MGPITVRGHIKGYWTPFCGSLTRKLADGLLENYIYIYIIWHKHYYEHDPSMVRGLLQGPLNLPNIRRNCNSRTTGPIAIKPHKLDPIIVLGNITFSLIFCSSLNFNWIIKLNLRSLSIKRITIYFHNCLLNKFSWIISLD